jgi:hypothetical protein
MRKIILNEEQFKRLIKLLKEQDEDDEYYRISPEDYRQLMKNGYYAPEVTMIKRFKGKPLYITSDLKVSDMPQMTSLGNVAYIDGKLDISNTKIANISKTKVKGQVTDYNSELYNRRIRAEERQRLNEADARREDGDWDLDNPDIDDEGLMANALFQYLVSESELDKIDEETETEIESKKEILNGLLERRENYDTLNHNEKLALDDQIAEIEDEIYDLQSGFGDVYYILPESYSYHNMTAFKVIGLDKEYIVGTYDEAYDSAIEHQKNLYDDIGTDGLSEDRIERYIDEDQVKEEMREYYEDSIRDSPESWFDSDDFQLTEEQEEKKEQLENYINEMEDLKSEREEELEGLGEDDEPSEMDIRKFLENNFNKKEIELTKLIDGFAKENNISVDRIRKFQRIIKLETEIEKIETNIDNAQDELDSIEPDTEPTEEMIEDKVESLVDSEEPIDYLKNMGADLKYYVDFDKIARDDVHSYGIELMASYDGSYDEEVVKSNGKQYRFVIMRIN